MARPVGAVGKITREAREKARATGELPHEFLLRMTRGEIITKMERQPDLQNPGKWLEVEVVEQYDLDARRAAAIAAAPFFAAKLSAVEVTQGMNDDDLDTLIREFAAQAGIGDPLGGEGEADETAAPEGRSGEGGKRKRRRVEL